MHVVAGGMSYKWKLSTRICSGHWLAASWFWNKQFYTDHMRVDRCVLSIFGHTSWKADVQGLAVYEEDEVLIILIGGHLIASWLVNLCFKT